MTLILRMLTLKKALFACFAVLFASSNSLANPACTSESSDCVRVGEWEFSLGVGYGQRTNPIIERNDISIYVLPGIHYYGKRFFWQTDTMGFTLYESHAQQLNLLGTLSYDQTYFNDSGVGNFSIEGGDVGGGAVDANRFAMSDTALGGEIDEPALEAGAEVELDNLHKRRTVGLAGIEYTFDHRWFSFGVQALTDATKVHNGSQVRTAISVAQQKNKFGMKLSLGVEWKDADTLNYFYGVRENEVTSPTLAYTVGDDISYYAKWDGRYRLSRHWELRAVAHNRWFGEKIENSPIVEDGSTTAFFIGGVYHF